MAYKLQLNLSAWMMHIMQLFQPLPRHMRINLRGGYIRMPQKHLHHTQIRAVIEQVRGKGMAQHMRAHVFSDACNNRIPFD